MADRVQQYLGRARQAEAWAERAADPLVKRQFRQIARQWRILAGETAPPEEPDEGGGPTDPA